VRLYISLKSRLSCSKQSTSTSFEQPSKSSSTFNIQSPWTSRFRERTQCSTNTTGKFICATGGRGSGQIPCNGAGGIPPVSLVKFTLASNNGQDFYDVSLIDGFNLPVSVKSQGGSGDCKTSSFPNDVNRVCPPNFAVDGSDGNVIACKSACLALNQPEYCCTGSFASPDKCPPNVYSVFFKNQCPLPYSYVYDDKTSTFTCFGGAKYSITFCPSNNVR